MLMPSAAMLHLNNFITNSMDQYQTVPRQPAGLVNTTGADSRFLERDFRCIKAGLAEFISVFLNIP